MEFMSFLPVLYETILNKALCSILIMNKFDSLNNKYFVVFSKDKVESLLLPLTYLAKQKYVALVVSNMHCRSFCRIGLFNTKVDCFLRFQFNENNSANVYQKILNTFVNIRGKFENCNTKFDEEIYIIIKIVF